MANTENFATWSVRNISNQTQQISILSRQLSEVQKTLHTSQSFKSEEYYQSLKTMEAEIYDAMLELAN